MRRFPLGIILVLLVACGATSNPPSQTDALATIGAGITVPTAPAVPTLTTEERASIKTISERAKSMTKAAQDLQALGQKSRATTEWKTRVRTAAQIITGGQQTIAQITFPPFYVPLAQRVKMVTESCAKPAETLIAADIGTLTIAAVQAQAEPLQRWCVTEMERLRLTVDALK